MEEGGRGKEIFIDRGTEGGTEEGMEGGWREGGRREGEVL